MFSISSNSGLSSEFKNDFTSPNLDSKERNPSNDLESAVEEEEEEEDCSGWKLRLSSFKKL